MSFASLAQQVAAEAQAQQAQAPTVASSAQTPASGTTPALSSAPQPVTNAGQPLQSTFTQAPGNGWDSVQPGTPEAALRAGQNQGKTGQALVDYVNGLFPGTAEYYQNFKGSGNDVYGLPGTYATTEGGGLNLVQRGDESGSSSGNASGSGAAGSLFFNPGPAFTPTPFTYNTPAFTPTQFTPTAFTAPTAQDAMNSPGEQFSLQQGIKAQQNSAFGRGLGLTGETAKGLEDYVNNTTQTDYGNVFNQALAVNQNANNTGLAATTANNASGLAANQNAYTQAYGTNALNNQIGLAANQNQYNQALGTNQTNFGNLFSLDSLGENAAALTGNLGAQNANANSSLITGGGNAAAAGTVGTGNAINNGITGGFNNLLYLNQLQNGSSYH